MAIRYTEQRKWPRLAVNAPGKVINISSGLRIKRVAPCRVLDVSAGGAQLEIIGGECDDSFYLEVDSEPNNLANCLVVRRSGNRVGVRFL